MREQVFLHDYCSSASAGRYPDGGRVLAHAPMAILLGATEAMVDDCVLYGRIVVCFLTSFMLQNMFQSFLIAAEQPKFGLLITLAAGVTNMVLDALFVGVFRWGIAGAAIATGISQTVGGVVPLMYFLFSKSSPLRLRWTKFEAQPLLRSCANGSSELMSNISGSLIGMLYNAQLMRFPGRGRRGDVWRTDVCAVHLRRD